MEDTHYEVKRQWLFIFMVAKRVYLNLQFLENRKIKLQRYLIKILSKYSLQIYHYFLISMTLGSGKVFAYLVTSPFLTYIIDEYRKICICI